MPSARALARRANVHHNTVSKAYQDPVRREWLTRKRGSRLVVGTPSVRSQQFDAGLDVLINETIKRAKRAGFALQMLRNRVRERLLEEPADPSAASLLTRTRSALREWVLTSPAGTRLFVSICQVRNCARE